MEVKHSYNKVKESYRCMNSILICDENLYEKHMHEMHIWKEANDMRLYESINMTCLYEIHTRGMNTGIWNVMTKVMENIRMLYIIERHTCVMHTWTVYACDKCIWKVMTW